MAAPATSAPDTRRARIYALVLAAVWTAVAVASLVWNIFQVRGEITAIARTQAAEVFQKDVIYRSWNSMHGGVYVPATERTPPNPYLKIPERDVTTPSGRKLTMVNPAYMLRQMQELQSNATGVHSHLTSLQPIRPGNKPDPWERRALERLERGDLSEVSAVLPFKGALHMRLMRPLVTERSCLSCHRSQGYREGDIRGGLSVSLPMARLLASQRAQILVLSAGHVGLWALGLLALAFSMGRLERQIRRRRQAEAEREELVGELQQALGEVKKLSGMLPICSSCKSVRDDKGYWKAIEVYIEEHSEAAVTHGLCEECVKKLYPDFARRDAAD